MFLCCCAGGKPHEEQRDSVDVEKVKLLGGYKGPALLGSCDEKIPTHATAAARRKQQQQHRHNLEHSLRGGTVQNRPSGRRTSTRNTMRDSFESNSSLWDAVTEGKLKGFGNGSSGVPNPSSHALPRQQRADQAHPAQPSDKRPQEVPIKESSRIAVGRSSSSHHIGPGYGSLPQTGGAAKRTSWGQGGGGGGAASAMLHHHSADTLSDLGADGQPSTPPAPSDTSMSKVLWRVSGGGQAGGVGGPAAMASSSPRATRQPSQNSIRHSVKSGDRGSRRSLGSSATRRSFAGDVGLDDNLSGHLDEQALLAHAVAGGYAKPPPGGGPAVSPEAASSPPPLQLLGAGGRLRARAPPPPPPSCPPGGNSHHQEDSSSAAGANFFGTGFTGRFRSSSAAADRAGLVGGRVLPAAVSAASAASVGSRGGVGATPLMPQDMGPMGEFITGLGDLQDEERRVLFGLFGESKVRDADHHCGEGSPEGCGGAALPGGSSPSEAVPPGAAEGPDAAEREYRCMLHLLKREFVEVQRNYVQALGIACTDYLTPLMEVPEIGGTPIVSEILGSLFNIKACNTMFLEELEASMGSAPPSGGAGDTGSASGSLKGFDYADVNVGAACLNHLRTFRSIAGYFSLYERFGAYVHACEKAATGQLDAASGAKQSGGSARLSVDLSQFRLSSAAAEQQGGGPAGALGLTAQDMAASGVGGSGGSVQSDKEMVAGMKAFMSVTGRVQAEVEEGHRDGTHDMSILGILVRPIQMLARYRTLLQRILDNTREDDPAYSLLVAACDESVGVCNYCNERKRESDGALKLAEVEKKWSLTGLASTPGRYCVMDAELVMLAEAILQGDPAEGGAEGVQRRVRVARQCVVFLCNDLLLCIHAAAPGVLPQPDQHISENIYIALDMSAVTAVRPDIAPQTISELVLGDGERPPPPHHTLSLKEEGGYSLDLVFPAEGAKNLWYESLKSTMASARFKDPKQRSVIGLDLHD